MNGALLGITSDVRETTEELVENLPIDVVFRRLDGFGHVAGELVGRYGTAADAEDRARQQALLEEAVEGGQRAAPREIARDPENDECVGRRRHAPPSNDFAACRSMFVPSSRSSTCVRSFAEWTSFVASSVSMVLIGKYPYAVVPYASRR